MDLARMATADTRAALDEREVVDAVLGGDRDAFRRLVEHESRAVIATCTRILGDRTEAEDVAQEAFLTAYRVARRPGGPTGRSGPGCRGSPSGRDPSRVAAQAGRLARSDVGRRCRGGDGQRGGADGDPAHSVLRSEQTRGSGRRRRARRAVSRGHRAAVLRGPALAEIAAVTDRPLGTVKTHLHRGLARSAPRRRGVGPMTAPRAFGPGELDGAEGLQVDDIAAETRIARDLEAMTSQAAALPSPDFTDRVMLAIDLEPVPAPAHAAAVALRRGAIGAFLASFSDAWRVATRSGFRGRSAPRRSRSSSWWARSPPAPGSRRPVPSGSSVTIVGCHRRLPRSKRPRPSCRAPAPRWPRRPSSRRRPSLRSVARPTSPDRAAGAHRAPDRLRRQPRRWERWRQRERRRRWRRGRPGRHRRPRWQADPEADQRLRWWRRGRDRRRRWQQRQRQRRQRWRRLVRSRRVRHGRRRRVTPRRPDAPSMAALRELTNATGRCSIPGSRAPATGRLAR